MLFSSSFTVRSLVILEAIFNPFLSQNIPGAVSELKSSLLVKMGSLAPHIICCVSTGAAPPALEPAWVCVYLGYRKDTGFVFLQWIKWTELANAGRKRGTLRNMLVSLPLWPFPWALMGTDHVSDLPSGSNSNQQAGTMDRQGIPPLFTG